MCNSWLVIVRAALAGSDPSVQMQILAGHRPLPNPEWEFEAKLIWLCRLMKFVLLLFLFTCISEPFELHSQPVLLLHMRIAVQTHCWRLCSTAQPPVKRMFWPLCNCDRLFLLPAEPLWTLHDFHSCCLMCFYSLSHESCRNVLLFGLVFDVSVFFKVTIWARK